MTTYDVCVLGMGPVGTVSGACYAKQGFNVIGIDINPARLNALKEGRAPFVEPGLETLLKEVIASGKFHASDDIGNAARSRIIMIAVGTPTPDGRAPDLSQLDKVCAEVGLAFHEKKVDHKPIIVVRSTVPPGTIRDRLQPIVEAASGMRGEEDFFMASNPEFLREGTAIADFFKTGRIIVGTNHQHVADAIQELYREVEAEARLHVSLESAEFAKYVDNTWHALKVDFANEIGRVCQAFGGKLDEMTEIFLSDHRLNISSNYLRPGFAFGGSCLPKDVRGLAWLADELGVAVPVVNAILPSNEEHIALGVNAILAENPKTVGMFGVAFKEHVDDLRESPALHIAADLMEQGIEVLAHDISYKSGDTLTLPASHRGLAISDADEVAERADVLVIMHRLPVYQKLAIRYASKPVVDLTRFPQWGRDYGKKAATSEKAALWSFGEAQAVSFPPKNETKKMPSIPIPAFLRKTIPT